MNAIKAAWGAVKATPVLWQARLSAVIEVASAGGGVALAVWMMQASPATPAIPVLFGFLLVWIGASVAHWLYPELDEDRRDALDNAEARGLRRGFRQGRSWQRKLVAQDRAKRGREQAQQIQDAVDNTAAWLDTRGEWERR